jgi:hypothetical protein
VRDALELPMAVGPILTVLSNIPWGTVVDNAPKVADGASRLWNSVTGKNKAPPAQSSPADAPHEAHAPQAERLAMRLQVVEEEVRQLNEQMQISSALIKDLAEQNTLLVQRVELNRLRLVRLAVAAACTGVVLVGAIVYLIASA